MKYFHFIQSCELINTNCDSVCTLFLLVIVAHKKMRKKSSMCDVVINLSAQPPDTKKVEIRMIRIVISFCYRV